MNTIRQVILSGLLGGMLVLGSNVSWAMSVTFPGSGSYDGGTLSASATFEISDDFLTLTLRNTADPATDNNTGGQDISANTLTGIFFDFAGNPNLTPLSATIAEGALVQFSQCSVNPPGPPPPFNPCSATTTDVGGEWYLSDSGETSLGQYGIASAGYLSGSNPTFGVENLDDPADSGAGISFGIIASPWNDLSNFNPNGGLANDPLISQEVVLVLNGAQGLSLDDLSNVSFQYGTSLAEPNFVNPEPATLLLFATGLSVLLAWRLKTRKQ